MSRGRIRGGGGHTRRATPPPPPPPPKIGKNMIFWRKIVIFHTKCPKNRRKWATLRHYYSFTLIHNTASEHVFIPEINPHCIWSQIHALFIEFYYALFLFLFFKDMHYNTMIRTFCIMKKMTFTAFHYLNLSIRCEELDTHIN